MAKYKSGIHTKLQTLLDKTGGYDPLYHAQSLSKELSITLEDAITLVSLTYNRDELNKYIGLIKTKNYSVDDIVKIHNISVQKSFKKLAYMTAMVGALR